jgi:hypothetical protein
MTEPLFAPMRTCSVCSAAIPEKIRRFDPRMPSILSLNVTIYRHTKAGAQLKTAKACMVCEDCLNSILASRSGKYDIKASLLATAIFGRISDCYNAMLEAKKA